MDIDEQKRFVFIKEYKTDEGSIPEGSELTIFRGGVYLNGGFVHLAYQKMLLGIVKDENLKKTYLKEIPIIHNKV